jgi:hypothetical protein
MLSELKYEKLDFAIEHTHTHTHTNIYIINIFFFQLCDLVKLDII